MTVQEISSPFKRVYFDITHEQHARMVEKAHASGMSQRAYLAKLIEDATGGKRGKK